MHILKKLKNEITSLVQAGGPSEETFYKEWSEIQRKEYLDEHPNSKFAQENHKELQNKVDVKKSNESVDSEVDRNVLQELYDTITEAMGDDFLSDYDETDYDSIVDAVDDFGREIDGYDSSNLHTRLAYAHALKEKWKNEHKKNDLDEDKYSKPSESNNDFKKLISLKERINKLKRDYDRQMSAGNNLIAININKKLKEIIEEYNSIYDSANLSEEQKNKLSDMTVKRKYF